MQGHIWSKQSVIICLSALVLFMSGFYIGRSLKEPVIIKPQILRENNSNYSYINPVLLCNTNNQQTYNEDKELSALLSSYVRQSQDSSISIYYLSLMSGAWSSINENMTFSPASMLKVPTMVDTLKYAESHPDILYKKIYFDGSFDNNNAEYYKPEKSISPNGYYTIDDLLTYTIKYSDNNAVALIHKALNTASLEELYGELNIDIPEHALDFMNTKTYALFLRVLYNSTYLTRDMSEKALGLMTDAVFPSGIEGGVPKDVKVAQKFGERQIFDSKGSLQYKELHDCGIVYAKNAPYILCVMTKGNDFDTLSKHIRDISKITYNHLIN